MESKCSTQRLCFFGQETACSSIVFFRIRAKSVKLDDVYEVKKLPLGSMNLFVTVSSRSTLWNQVWEFLRVSSHIFWSMYSWFGETLCGCRDTNKARRGNGAQTGERFVHTPEQHQTSADLPCRSVSMTTLSPGKLAWQQREKRSGSGERREERGEKGKTAVDM